MDMNREDSTVKVDTKDRKILLELDFDARQTNSKIAKKIGLSKQGVEYRINNLIKKGVILGFYPMINNSKLGYIYGRILFRFQNLDGTTGKRLVEDFKSNKKFNWILKSEGQYEFGTGIWVKTLSEFKEIVRNIKTKYSAYIKDLRESIAIRVTHYQYRVLLNTENTKKVVFEETPLRVELDILDKRILKLLCDNARAPLVEMSNKLNVSPKVLAYRIKKLEKNGVILGYRPLIDHSLLGYTYYKILFYLNATKNEFETFRRYLEDHPKVIYIVDEVGICDIDVEAMFESERDYFDFMKELKLKFPKLIKEYETLIGMENLKVNYLPYDL